jgi:hypothetical protein
MSGNRKQKQEKIMTMQEMAAIWPHEIATMDKNGKATYAPQTVTVAKVFNGERGLGLKFAEDQTPDGNYKGVIWNVGGKWNEMANKPDRYDGPVPQEGQQITVTLSAKKGDSRFFRDCTINSEHYYTPEGEQTFDSGRPAEPPVQPASVAAQPPQDDPGWPSADADTGKPLSDAPPAHFRDATRESIEKQVVVKEVGAMLVALSHHTGNEVEMFTFEQMEWMRQQWFDGLYELKHGTPPPQPEASEEAGNAG